MKKAIVRISHILGIASGMAGATLIALGETVGHPKLVKIGGVVAILVAFITNIRAGVTGKHGPIVQSKETLGAVPPTTTDTTLKP